MNKNYKEWTTKKKTPTDSSVSNPSVSDLSIDRLTNKTTDRSVHFPSPVSISLFKERKKVRTFGPDSIPFRLSAYLWKFVRENFPKFKQPELQRWAKHVDLMIRIDKREPDDIGKVIKWAQTNEFWKKNLLSTEKLRKQFDTIQAQMGGLK